MFPPKCTQSVCSRKPRNPSVPANVTEGPMRTNLLPSAASALAWLERDNPGKEPERIELSRLPFTLGRNESCDFQILSSRVSREHAELVREAGVLIIRDLKSTNGTLVNGQRIDEHRLVDGDLVVI